jgi:ABC-type antimicrobial peptide transport system permease subunit
VTRISQRRREVAIRLAIGATASAVFRMTLADGQIIAAVGVLGGAILAYVAGRILASTLYEVSAADPLVLSRRRPSWLASVCWPRCCRRVALHRSNRSWR